MAQLWLRMAVMSFWILCLILLALVGIKWCASQDFAWAGLMPMQVCLTFSQSEIFDHEMLVHPRGILGEPWSLCSSPVPASSGTAANASMLTHRGLRLTAASGLYSSMRVTVFAPVTYLTLVILCMYNPAIHILLLEGRTQALLAMQTVPSYSLYRLHTDPTSLVQCICCHSM